MSYALTDRAKDSISREVVEPNMVLVIEGSPKKYAVRVTSKKLRYDAPGLNYDDGYFYDGLIPDDSVSDLISISGTTNSISQQLDPDKGAASSTQTLTLSLIDRNEEITRLITPGEFLPEILYRNAKVYLGFNDTAFPEDYIQIFDGKIMSVDPGVGTINMVITHPDDVKRSSIFQKIDSNLTDDALFDSAKFGGITYAKRSDVTGVVTVTYTFAGIGNNAVVSVTGNDISVQVDTSLTQLKTIKKKIEAHEDASQLVTAVITTNGASIQATTGSVTLSSSTEIFVDSVAGYLPPIAPLFKSYIRINDEIIEYTAIDSVANKFTGCTRQSLTSLGASHKIGDTVSSFYKYGDGTTAYDAVDMALYLLLSGPSKIYLTSSANAVGVVPGIGVVADSIYMPNVYLIRDHGSVIGDYVTITGSSIPANNVTNAQITEVVEIDDGTYLTLNQSLTQELLATLTVTFKSVYNVLDDGLNLTPSQVDIAQFRFIKRRYSRSLANYEFYLKDTVTAKEFINTQLLMPSKLYSVPRKGRISAGITAAPLYAKDTPVLTLENIKNPKGLRLSRGVTKNFYNAVAYQYNTDSVDDKFLAKTITLSADSKNVIDSPIKLFSIKSDGLRPSLDTNNLIETNSKGFLDRYKFGAEVIKVPVLFKTGFAAEVGDSVVFGDPDLYLPDTKSGSKDFNPRIMEIVNKDFNWVKGDILLTLLDTTYSNTFKYGVFSPTTLIGSGSTTTEIVMTKSFGTDAITKEKAKWESYIGKTITVHSLDRSTSYTTIIQGFDPGNDNIMNVLPALPVPAPAGYLIDIPDYQATPVASNIFKSIYCYFDPQVAVVSGASDTSFDVSIGDAAKFFVGSLIRVHNPLFTVDSGINASKVLTIVGTTITCESLGFTPDSTMFVELIGFASDEGKPYAFV